MWRRVGPFVAAAVVLAACRPDTVHIGFRPAAGAHYRYRVEVTVHTVTRLAGQQPSATTDKEELDARQDVLSATAAGSRVQVRLTASDGSTRTFTVRLDRAAQLAEVQSVEGLPARVLGDLGLSEIFPAAAGAPPERPLGPGDRWSLQQSVRLPGGAPTTLRGRGRLVALGVVRGRKVATTSTSFELPVESTQITSNARITLQGTQQTTSNATRALADGAIQEEQATTTGQFTITLLPPDGGGPAVPGTLELEVRSTTVRVG